MKILIAGDFCPRQRIAECFKNNDFESVLGSVKPVIQSADYSIVNFECPVCNGGEKPIEKCGPNLCCSEDGIKAAKWAGFKCLSLANNHFFDFGIEGVKNTLDTCRTCGLDTVGAGLDLKEASEILYKRFNDKVLAIINCCEHEFSIATETTAGSNPLNPIQQYYAIKEAKGKADHVVVIVHGGHEHYQLPSPRMVETYRFFIDAGADAVVNHHQHCYSGYEVYNGKPVFYGLGNFCFDWQERNNDKWNYGYMVCINMDEQIGFEIIPYRQCADIPTIDILPKDSFDIKLDELNQVILFPDKLKEQTEAYYKSSDLMVSRIFEPMDNRIFRALRKKGLLSSFITKNKKLIAQDYICCEAHRDKILHWLNK